MGKMIGRIVLAILVGWLSGAEAENAAAAGMTLPPEVAVQVDLDGDGATEQIAWRAVPVDEYDERMELEVTGASGDAKWESGFLHSVYVDLVDMDADGVYEIFVSGDEMSDDYATFCLQYKAGELKQLMFPDAARGENADGYYDAGYGKATRFGDNLVTLCGSQDMVGTYMSERTFTLQNGQFEFADDGLWIVTRDINDPEVWEWGALTLKMDMPTMFKDGTAGVLRAGDKVLVTAGDKVSTVYFLTEDGKEGYFMVAKNQEKPWLSLVNGVSEDELFEYVPYAD